MRSVYAPICVPSLGRMPLTRAPNRTLSAPIFSARTRGSVWSPFTKEHRLRERLGFGVLLTDRMKPRRALPYFSSTSTSMVNAERALKHLGSPAYTPDTKGATRFQVFERPLRISHAGGIRGEVRQRSP